MQSVIERSFGVNLRVMQILLMYPPEKPTRLYRVFVYIAYSLLILPIPILGCTYYVFEDNIDMERLADNAFVFAEMVCYVTKFLPFITHGDKIKRCIHYFEAPLFAVFKDQQKLIIDRSVRICRRNCTIFLVSVVGGTAVWAVKPLFTAHYRLPLDVWIPVNLSEKRGVYCFAYFYIVLGVAYPAFASAVIDPLIGGLACLATAQLQVLKDNLEHLGEYAEAEQTTKQLDIKSEIIYDKIKQCIEAHNAVLAFVEEFQECFSSVVFSQLAGSIFVICFCCLQLSILEPMNFAFITMLSDMAIILAQIYFYCYYGTVLFEENNTLSNAVYVGPWYEYDVKSRKALIVLMERSKRPMIVTAGKILDLSLVTFTTILRRSYSLLAVMKNQ